jgi:3-dehydroquinate synthetase
LLEARGLPLSFGGAGVDDVLELIGRDKKRTGGTVPFVLVEAPGAVTTGHTLNLATLRAAVEEVHAG